MRQLNNLSDVYLEAVYGKTPSKKKDTRMVVTNADKKANTPAYQNLKKGVKGYKAADHMDEEKKKGLDGKACWDGYKLAGTKKKGGKTVDNCVPVKENKKADKDYDGDGKIESGKDEYFGSKDKAIKKAMGKKVKEEFSDWRADLVEMDLIEVVDDDSDKEDDDYGSEKKVKEKKVKNCVKVNPNVKIESVQEGKKKKKGHDCASKVKHEEYGVGDCLKEMHDLDEDGNVSHYDVKFASRIVRNVPSSDLVVLEGMYHEHVIRDEIEVNEVAPVVAMAGKAALAGGAWAAGEAAAKKIVKKKEDKKSETVEGYQRDPERGEREDTRSARQKRMDDPDKGINSPAFRKFMANREKASSAKKVKKSAPTKSKRNPEGTLHLSPEERKKREEKRRLDLYKRSADMRRDQKKRGVGVYAKGAHNPGADMDKKLGI
tara:strand:+ start:3383 stop:4675 length:1293 start_codon:yes stop_codon:yes gene_type:complete